MRLTPERSCALRRHRFGLPKLAYRNNYPPVVEVCRLVPVLRTCGEFEIIYPQNCRKFSAFVESIRRSSREQHNVNTHRSYLPNMLTHLSQFQYSKSETRSRLDVLKRYRLYSHPAYKRVTYTFASVYFSSNRC